MNAVDIVNAKKKADRVMKIVKGVIAVVAIIWTIGIFFNHLEAHLSNQDKINQERNVKW